MCPEPNFPARPDAFVRRQAQIEIFREGLYQGLRAGRTESFAVLGDGGPGASLPPAMRSAPQARDKSSLLLEFATLCSQRPFASSEQITIDRKCPALVTLITLIVSKTSVKKMYWYQDF
jgi:hypothetical protein